MNGIGAVVRAHNIRYSSSTQAKGMVRRSNPYTPPPWESNLGISKMTDLFADSVPTIGAVEVASRGIALDPGNPAFGNVLMQVKAMNQQRANQIDQLLSDQGKHEAVKGVLLNPQHQEAWDSIRGTAGDLKDTVGEAYRELIQIMPNLPPAAAGRLMQGIIDDPVPIESLQDSTDAKIFIDRKMQDAGLSWTEIKKGRTSSAKVKPADPTGMNCYTDSECEEKYGGHY